MTVPGEFDFDDMLDEDFEIPNDPSNLDLDLDLDLEHIQQELLLYHILNLLTF